MVGIWWESAVEISILVFSMSLEALDGINIWFVEEGTDEVVYDEEKSIAVYLV